MTKKDFFRILIKVFGLYSIIQSLFVVLPETLPIINGYFGSRVGEGIIGILFVLAMLAFIVFLFVVLIRKTDTVIRWLRLDKGFDDDKIYFEGLTPENILKLSAIVVGGLLIIDHVPSFLSETYQAFANHLPGSEQGQHAVQTISWATSFMDVIIGFLLVRKYEQVGKLLRVNRKEEQ
jgi:hypothetical protein